MRHKLSFSRRLSLNILIVTSILFIVSLAVAAISSHVLIAEEATKSAEHLRDATAAEIEKTLQGVEIAVRSSAASVREHIADKDYPYLVTTKMVELHPNIIGATVAFRENFYPGVKYCSPYSYKEPATGAVVEKELGNDNYDYFSMDWYTKPVSTGEGCWSEPYYDDGGGDCVMSTYSWPLKDGDGGVFAVLTADIPLAWVTDMLADIKPYPSSNVSLVSPAGSFINAGNGTDLRDKNIFYGEQSIRNKRQKAKVHEISEHLLAGDSGVMQYTNGRKRAFIVYGPLENGWILSITCAYNEVLARTSKMHLILFILGIAGIIFLFILSYLTIRRLTRPLVDFSESAINIAKGNFNTPLPEIQHDDEINRLRNSFDYMQHSLNSYITNLQTTTAAKERIESELNIASKIQMSMLSTDFPKNDLVDLHAMLKPAKEVGGDFYDFVLRGKVLYFTVGDVSGKGVPASMFMAMTRSAFRFITGLELPLDEVVSKINNAVCDGNESGMFVTLFVGRLDLETGDLQYCNAGHNPIMLNGEFLKTETNIAVGVLPDFPYKMNSIALERGAKLLLYTDGVTEAERADKEQFGDTRLFEWTHTVASCTPQQACDLLYKNVLSFADGNAQNDDITIMTIKYK